MMLSGPNRRSTPGKREPRIMLRQNKLRPDRPANWPRVYRSAMGQRTRREGKQSSPAISQIRFMAPV